MNSGKPEKPEEKPIEVKPVEAKPESQSIEKPKGGIDSMGLPATGRSSAR